MYFWRIEQLKDQLIARPLSDREALPYLLVFVGLTAAIGFIPGESLNVWDHVGTTLSVILTILGTLWVYRQNGGAAGHFFLQRYLTVGWVIGIRWVVGLFAIFFPLYFVLSLLSIESDVSTWYDTAIIAAAELVMYWRIGSHVEHVASRAKSA